MITVITPTGERPEAFALCQMMLERQTYTGKVHWIVVDDGETPQEVTLDRPGWEVTIVRPQPFWKPGENTQARNLIAGLDAGEPDTLTTIWEDDDWYSPEWLSALSQHAPRAELIGESKAVYFNVRTRRYGQLRNYQHSSLRCSAMRGDAIVAFRQVLTEFSRYYDFKLWKSFENCHVFDGDMTVGIKGMPGRPGIATGHSDEWGTFDPEMTRLRRWIGKDADLYADYYREDIKMSNQIKKMRALRDFKYGERGLVRKGQEFELRSAAEESLFLANGRAETLDAKPKEPRTFKPQVQERKLETVEKSDSAPDEELGTEEAEEEGRPKRGRRRAVRKAD